MSLIAAAGVWSGLNLASGLASWCGFRLWRRHQDWTADGLLPSAVPYAMGTGADAVLFVHGFNDVPFVWKRMAETVAAQGCAAEAMRLPGAGERHPKTSLARLRTALDERIAALSARHARVFLVGHSMGGALVLDALARMPHATRVAGACLLAPLIEIARARSPLLPPQAWRRILQTLLPAVRCLPSVFRREPAADDDPSFRYRRDGWNALCSYAALFDLVKRVRTLDRAAIRTPFRVWTAGEDRVVDSAAAAAWFGECPACQGVAVVPGARHELQMQPCWKDICREILAFCRDGRRAPGGSA